MALTSFDLPEAVITEIFTKARHTSAALTLSRDLPLYSPNDAVVFSFNGDDAKFHRAGDATDKDSGNDVIDTVEVPVRTLYRMMDFPDFRADDAIAERVIDRIISEVPGRIALTFDKAIFGPTLVPSSPWTGFTGGSLAIDGTQASVLAVIEAIESDGHAPNGAILDNSFKASIRRAFTEGTTTSPLNLSITDNGFMVGGVSIYFRDLGSPTGVFGDFSQAAAGVYKGLETEIFYPGNDRAQRVKNMVSVYAGFYTGFVVADQTAFRTVTLAEPTP